MKRYLYLMIILLVSLFSLTGCWDVRELNELSMVSALGIDSDPEGYLVSVQLINVAELSKDKSGQVAPIVTHRTSGKTLHEAFRKLKLEVPRRIYLAHLRLVVFGEKFARDEGLSNALDFISRDHEMRTDFYIVIAKDIAAEKLLNVLTPIQQIPANHISSALEISSTLWGASRTVQIDELVNTLGSDGKEPTITGVFIKGSTEEGMEKSSLEKADVPSSVQIHYLSVFKDDKLIGWLDEAESISYSYITGNIKSTSLALPWYDGQIGIEISSSKPKTKVEITNGKPKILLECTVTAHITESNSKLKLSDSKNIILIEKALEKELENSIKMTIASVQKNFKSDIFGFGEVIHISDPKQWKILKEDWDSAFEDLEVAVKVSAKIHNVGRISDSFENDFTK